MDVSYLHGRAVEAVLTGDDAAAYEGAKWVIQLEGDGFILCFDESYEAPELSGLAFTTSTVSADEVRMYFGTDQNPMGTLVMLRPDDTYGVADQAYSDGNIVRPSAMGVAEAAEPLVAASDTGGEVEGPTDEFLAAEAEREAAEEARLAEAQEPVEEDEDDGA